MRSFDGALSNAGTMLIGNDANGEALGASASRNDTLTGGNGNNDILPRRNTSGNLILTVGNGTKDVFRRRRRRYDDGRNPSTPAPPERRLQANGAGNTLNVLVGDISNLHDQKPV